MLSLDNPRWTELRHAYGDASNIPALLLKLRSLPDSEGESEPWFTLWSSLAHQGDVYSASFAAVPHVVAALARDPTKASSTYFLFPAWVEICRSKKSVLIQAELQAAYDQALGQLPGLVALASTREWDEGMLVCALAAIAAAKGFPQVAEAALELTPDLGVGTRRIVLG